MDIYKAIDELKNEKKRLDRAIEALEAGKGAPEERSGRRRTWNSDARSAAAERMKKYWAQRRQQNAVKAAAASYNVSPPSTKSD